MTLRPIDNYFLNKQEPIKSCLQFLREYIVHYDKAITEAWKYGMPFYLYNGKMFCYLWTHKKYGQPYIGIVEGMKVHHPLLLQEKRARMKILLLDSTQDLPVNTITEILAQAIALYK